MINNAEMFSMKFTFKIILSIIILAIAGLLTACEIPDAKLEIINNYHEDIIKIGLEERMHDVNIAHGENYIHSSLYGSYRVFVITNDNKASNFVPFYAASDITITITLDMDGILMINQ